MDLPNCSFCKAVQRLQTHSSSCGVIVIPKQPRRNHCWQLLILAPPLTHMRCTVCLKRQLDSSPLASQPLPEFSSRFTAATEQGNCVYIFCQQDPQFTLQLLQACMPTFDIVRVHVLSLVLCTMLRRPMFLSSVHQTAEHSLASCEAHKGVCNACHYLVLSFAGGSFARHFTPHLRSNGHVKDSCDQL